MNESEEKPYPLQEAAKYITVVDFEGGILQAGDGWGVKNSDRDGFDDDG